MTPTMNHPLELRCTRGIPTTIGRIFRFLALLAFLLPLPFATLSAAEADVIVYGATPGGFCAAIAAAREGATVFLLEPTDHVGGVNTGGLCFSDSNQTLRSTVMGLFDEWHRRIEEDYRSRGVELPYQVREKDHRHWTYEPHVAMRVTRQMLGEAPVQVLTKQVLQSVVKEGAHLTRLRTSAGEFRAKVFIDGSYEGDLMAAAGVSWTIGREGRQDFGESLAGKRYPKPKMPISGRDDAGALLPLVTTGDAGPEDAGDKNVMVYSFRLCVTKDPKNRVPFPPPTRYDPARFEVIRRHFSQGKAVAMWDLYPLPGGKFDANNGIGRQFSLGFVGACNGWSEADQAGRAAIWEAHKQYTLEFYHFFCTDPSVPEPLRKEHAEFGLCRDEFPDYDHWSPQLYVREGRRMKGMFVIRQQDIVENPTKDDPIVISSFPIDSHDCQRVATEDGVVDEGTIMPLRMPGRGHGYVYHIPYRSIVPMPGECDNLLVPVALSCTHVGISSIRVEPTWMLLGQSAGVAAALAARQGVTVQQLPYPTLRERLLAQRQVLDIPPLPPPSASQAGAMSIDPAKVPGIVLDDKQATLVGEWKPSSGFKPYVGTGYIHDEKRGDGQSIATFRFTAPTSGRYDLRIAYSPHETRAKEVPITIESGSQPSKFLFDQTQPLPVGEAFRSVGLVQLSSNTETTIVLSNTGTEGFVILDAIQLIPVPEQQDPRAFAEARRDATLPGTSPLTPNPDFSATMVAGIDRMALRLIEQSRGTRAPTVEKLKAALGIVDERLPVKALELVGDTDSPSLLAETERCRVFRVRWPVFEGVHGEGLYVQPKGQPIARVICLPDADGTPEGLVDGRLLDAGCEVVIPALVSRGTEFSQTESLDIRTNVSHREWIYRQSYELGRHPIGYEVQKTLAVVDWFKTRPEQTPVIVAGVGEGGLLALNAAAIDQQIDGVYCAGYFAPREAVWQEPLERNVFGLLRDFGDAEIASLIAPRPLVLHHVAYPEYAAPGVAANGVRAVTAPGRLIAPDRAAFAAEVLRARTIAPASRILAVTDETPIAAIVRHLLPGDAAESVTQSLRVAEENPRLPEDPTRQGRLVKELERFSQRLVVISEAERSAQFWRRLPLQPLAAYEAQVAKERARFWNEVIGRLPDPNLPMNARSRLVRETEKVAVYEVTMDVWEDVFAWGWLCLPKDLAAGERRPVVVCQHGLEGLPEDTITEDPSSRVWGSYKSFALRLAEQGFVTFAPHNPYRGKDAFRTLQRKLNPLGLTLYSVINGQHQRILEWLRSQPFVQPDKIAFYGLSYGGKSAMRTPAVLTDYCLSICSGDFNEWVRYCVSTDLPIPSYIHTGEYEIWEWNLARQFNYAEMGALIAPRPFMVERGHDDGCGTDEWVNYEYAKIRRLYTKLGIGDRTTIEHFDGPHTIHGVGTFQFLKEQLSEPAGR